MTIVVAATPIELPRESVELLATTVLVNGEAVADYEVAVTVRGERPEDWAAPVTAGDTVGPLIEGLDPGAYTVWARYADTPETPVIELGTFKIT